MTCNNTKKSRQLRKLIIRKRNNRKLRNNEKKHNIYRKFKLLYPDSYNYLVEQISNISNEEKEKVIDSKCNPENIVEHYYFDDNTFYKESNRLCGHISDTVRDNKYFGRLFDNNFAYDYYIYKRMINDTME